MFSFAFHLETFVRKIVSVDLEGERKKTTCPYKATRASEVSEAGPVSVAWKPKLFVAPNKGMLNSRVFLFEQKQAPVHGGYFWFVISLWLSDTNMSEIKIKVGEPFGGENGNQP